MSSQVKSNGALEHIFGFGIAAFIHLGLPAIIILALGAAALLKPLPPPPPDEPAVTAHFARLGIEVDVKDLPTRVRPGAKLKSSKQNTNSKRGAPTLKDPDPDGQKEQTPDQVVRNLVDDLGLDTPDKGESNNAGEVDKDSENTEGDPQQTGSLGGVEGGDSDQKTGNEYLGQLNLMFRKGWSVPTTVSDEEVKGLKATALMNVNENYKILGCKIINPSGNAIFDASINQRCQALTGTELPEPPQGIEHQFKNAAIRLRLSGAQARR